MQRAADQASSYATRCDIQLYMKITAVLHMPLPIRFGAMPGPTLLAKKPHVWGRGKVMP